MNAAMGAQRKRERKKRILLAYAARFTAVCVCSAVMILIACGFLYILDHLFQNDSVVYGEVVNTSAAGNTDYTEETNKLNIAGGRTVVIDAGHGGDDEGTAYDGVKEKEVVLDIALALKEELEERGFSVLLTRTDDTLYSLLERAEIANQAKADLFLSIHVDYYEDDAAINGLTCHYMQGSAEGTQLASVMEETIRALGITDVRESIGSDFSVLRNTEMPALLIETGFLSNGGDREKLSQREYRRELAKAIADGAAEIFNEADNQRF